MVDLKRLRDILRKERKMDELIELEDNFYLKIGKYIRDLEEEIKEKEDENKREMLKDEKESALTFVEKTFERRTGKILRLASLSLKGLNVDENNMTSEEKNIFSSLSKQLKKGRKRIKQTIFSDEIKEKSKSKEKEKFNSSKKPFTVVRVLENFPKFIGSDERSYHLSKEDVVSLPEEDAKVLLKREIAQKIEGDN